MRSAPEQTTPTGTQDVEMESAGSPDHHPSLGKYDADDLDLSHPDAPPSHGVQGKVNDCSSYPSVSNGFSGNDDDDDRARSC
ncbi:hypothetical protein GQ600_24554 [Phytophthora cactorum]|nr:hypothetical protein GQ600_24554 [Phytophthora cactorum]